MSKLRCRMVRSPSASNCLGVAEPSRVPRPAAARMADTNMTPGLYSVGGWRLVVAPRRATFPLPLASQPAAGGRREGRSEKRQRRRLWDHLGLHGGYAHTQIVHRPRLVVEALIALAEDEEFDGCSRSGMTEIRETRI